MQNNSRSWPNNCWRPYWRVAVSSQRIYSGKIIHFLKNFIRLFVIIADVPFRKFVDQLPLARAPINANNTLATVIPVEKLTIEDVLYWGALIEHASKQEDLDSYLDEIVCELSDFCEYVR